VAIHHNSSKRDAETLVEEIRAAGGSACAIAADLTKPDEVASLMISATDSLGPITGLVNNASRFEHDDISTIDIKSWDSHMDVNARAPMLLIRALLEQLPNDAQASVINILDQKISEPNPDHLSYTASRYALLGLTDALARGLAPAVRVNAVAPGWIASSGMDNYPAHMKSWIRSLADAVPIKRMGTESEVSSAICFLLSPGAAFISGDCLRIDGAASQGGRVWPMPKAKNNEPYNGFHRAVTPKVLSDD